MAVNEMFVEPDEIEDIEFSSTDSELEIFDNWMYDGRSNTTNSPSEFSSISRSSNESNYLRPNIVDYECSCKEMMEGRYLYYVFLYEELIKNNIRPPEYMNRFRSNIEHMICDTGLTLLTLADRFEMSEQRKWIREQAQNVVFQKLDFYSFTERLKTLFEVRGLSSFFKGS